MWGSFLIIAFFHVYSGDIMHIVVIHYFLMRFPYCFLQNLMVKQCCVECVETKPVGFIMVFMLVKVVR